MSGAEEHPIEALEGESRQAHGRMDVVDRWIWSLITVVFLTGLLSIVVPPLRERNRERVYRETVRRIRREFPNGKP